MHTQPLCARHPGAFERRQHGEGLVVCWGGWKPLRRRSDSASGGRRGQGRTQGVPTALVMAGGAGGKQKAGEWMPQSSQGGAGGLPPSTAGGPVLWQACRLTSNSQGLQKGKQQWDASGSASETVLPREKAGCQKRVGGLSQSPALPCRHLAPACLKTLSISMTGVVVSMRGLAKLCICL